MAKDISTVGARITITGGTLGKPLVISEFSDEGTPFDAPDVDASENRKNLNGIMISSRTPSVYPFAVTVIPGSVADLILTKQLAQALIQPGSMEGETRNMYFEITVSIPEVVDVGSRVAAGDAIHSGRREYTYTNARMKTAPTGPSSSAEGRQAARTFAWEAEGFIPPAS